MQKGDLIVWDYSSHSTVTLYSQRFLTIVEISLKGEGRKTSQLLEKYYLPYVARIENK